MKEARKVRFWLDLLVLGLASLAVCLFLLWSAGSASGAGFQVGIADPMRPISQAEVSTLGLSLERRLVAWNGQDTFRGSLDWTPGLRPFLAVFGGYPWLTVPMTAEERADYCGFVVSILKRYPNVHDVIVWNEPNLASMWGSGPDAYAELLVSCSSVIRSAGARIWAPGMSPSTVAGISNFARGIAKRGAHLIDGWDQHDYGALPALKDRIAAVRAAFGWRIPVLIGESGANDYFGHNTIPSLMSKAYCAGAIGWLNFAPWSPDFAPIGREIKLIRSGGESCSSVQPPSPLTNPLPRRARLSSRYICPHGAGDVELVPTRSNIRKGICVLP